MSVKVTIACIVPETYEYLPLAHFAISALAILLKSLVDRSLISRVRFGIVLETQFTTTI